MNKHVRYAIKFTLITFVIGLIIGMGLRLFEQEKELIRLSEELNNTQEQLLISNDKLKQIDARNEAIKYMDGVVE